jgi:hypothetical protein
MWSLLGSRISLDPIVNESSALIEHSPNLSTKLKLLQLNSVVESHACLQSSMSLIPYSNLSPSGKYLPGN